MLFNSFQFLLFFPIVTVIYFLLPQKYRWFHLLIASCIFYTAFIPVYIFILFFTIVIDYFAGLMISKSEGKRRKFFLVLSIVANVSVLAVFKYYNFFIDNINGFAKVLHLNMIPWNHFSIILPIGLSFHTFQAMSYTIEVYKGRYPPEKNFGMYALYVMFYPQLVAGPIERPQNVLPQLHRYHAFDYSKLVMGLRLILWGLFKKVVIADRLALMVNEVYNHVDHYTGFAYVIATILFGIQIYCDFSGYSDIAIGTARVMGIDLMVNFRRPYFSHTVSEFWKRWHISLSTWFRDYVYIPLGGNRGSKFKTFRNLFLVFLISGFWHGANWTFVIWGALHGTYLIVSLLLHRVFPSLTRNNLINIVITFLLVQFAWIFFRANTLHDATTIISHLGTSGAGSSYWNLLSEDHMGNKLYLGVPLWKFASSLLLIPLLFLADWMLEKNLDQDLLESRPMPLKWAVYYIMIIVILVFGVFDTNQFIYFQF